MGPVEEASSLWEVAMEEASSLSALHLPTDWPDTDAIDELIPGHEIIEPIGCGGMGVVYLAWQGSIEREVAIKVIRLNGADRDFQSDRFEMEAKTMGRLSHSNIVPVFDFGTDGTFCWIVMEMVPGQDLRKILHSRCAPFHPEAVAAMAIQITEALAHAHERGVVHRDLKPSNILIENETGRVRIIDFGISKTEFNPSDSTGIIQTVTGTLMGTAPYLAPEILNSETGAKKADVRSDIYGCGVVFYELLTGTVPRGMFPMPSEISEACEKCDSIVARCLAPDPEKRFQNAGEMLDAIQSIGCHEEDVGARQEAILPTEPFSFHNTLLGAGMACFLFLCVFVASGENRFSLLSTASPKQFQNALALLLLTALFNLLWLVTVLVSWKRQKKEVSTFFTFATSSFVLLGNSFIVYLAVSD